jgi:hypothetical protein
MEGNIPNLEFPFGEELAFKEAHLGLSNAGQLADQKAGVW